MFVDKCMQKSGKTTEHRTVCIYNEIHKWPLPNFFETQIKLRALSDIRKKAWLQAKLKQDRFALIHPRPICIRVYIQFLASAP